MPAANTREISVAWRKGRTAAEVHAAALLLFVSAASLARLAESSAQPVPLGARQPAVKDGHIQSGENCYTSLDSLGHELYGVVKSVDGPAVDGDTAEATAHLAGKHFPYSNPYCRQRADKYLALRPAGCSLTPFRVEGFLDMIRGRRVVLWGDSVQRQFFTYLAVRLEDLASSGSNALTNKAHYRRVSHGCVMRSTAHPKTGLQLNEPCFDVATDWEHHCHTYHSGATALCFVRSDGDVVDDRNVAFFNDLRPSDVVLANIGLHFNHQDKLAAALDRFATLLGHQAAAGRPLPLWLWRDTSPQHFTGGLGGNFPTNHGLQNKLRNVNKWNFRCTHHPLDLMRRTDWRNRVLIRYGLKSFEAHNLSIPVLRVWNTTALLAGKHPQTLSTSTVADCTHHCPTLGGVYEMWATLFSNFLSTALHHLRQLRPPPPPPGSPKWRYPTKTVKLI